MSKLRITQRRSRNGANGRQLETLRSLGLRRINHTVEREDSPQLRGMLRRVAHLVEVEEGGGAARSRAAGGRATASGARAGGPGGDS